MSNGGIGDSSTFSVRKFDIKKIKKDSIIVVIGKRNTGKSFLVRDILYHNSDIPMGTVISHTDHLNKWYQKFIPPILIHKRYSPEVLDRILERQRKANKEEWQDPSAFLLMDDCLADSDAWKKDENIKEIFFNGRWYKLLFILSMQSPMGIPPSFRDNIDYTFILKNNNASAREKIFKHYAGAFPDKKTFEKAMNVLTDDYKCIVIDNATHSNKMEDQVFFYKAEERTNFRICSDAVWRRSNQILSKMEDPDDADYVKRMRKKNTNKITIKM